MRYIWFMDLNVYYTWYVSYVYIHNNVCIYIDILHEMACSVEKRWWTSEQNGLQYVQPIFRQRQMGIEAKKKSDVGQSCGCLLQDAGFEGVPNFGVLQADNACNPPQKV